MSASSNRPDLSQLRIDRGSAPGPRRWPWAAVAGLTAVLAAFAVWKWGPDGTLEVSVATARAPTLSRQATVLDASGYVTARRQATVSSKRTGKVKVVLVEEGMAVEEGQVVAYLEDETEAAQLALVEAQLSSGKAALKEIEAQLREAQRTLHRTKELSERRLASTADLDAARASVEALEARLATGKEEVKVADRSVALQRQLFSETVIRAPFSGIVIAKTAQPGEMISPVSAGGGFTRTGICTIVDMESLEIEVDVNEAYIQRVEAGQPVTAVLDAYPDWRIPSEVIAIVPTADRQKATVRVRVGFLEKDGRVLPDMGVKVAFLDATASAADAAQAPPKGVLIPSAAVQEQGGGSFVWALDGSRATRRDLRLGLQLGDSVQVLDGLDAGERVIVAPPVELTEGAEVSVGG